MIDRSLFPDKTDEEIMEEVKRHFDENSYDDDEEKDFEMR